MKAQTLQNLNDKCPSQDETLYIESFTWKNSTFATQHNCSKVLEWFFFSVEVLELKFSGTLWWLPISNMANSVSPSHQKKSRLGCVPPGIKRQKRTLRTQLCQKPFRLMRHKRSAMHLPVNVPLHNAAINGSIYDSYNMSPRHGSKIWPIFGTHVIWEKRLKTNRTISAKTPLPH